ncbi:hypothetical protein WS75_15295 [Burkholderia sp. FL-7-2-10-S1-D7]|nr:hypothetical protein WS75_15295 [Burkholderia sp. FL-7-2-10-S1-D7]
MTHAFMTNVSGNFLSGVEIAQWLLFPMSQIIFAIIVTRRWCFTAECCINFPMSMPHTISIINIAENHKVKR